jgi:hypothetical protein
VEKHHCASQSITAAFLIKVAFPVGGLWGLEVESKSKTKTKQQKNQNKENVHFLARRLSLNPHVTNE